MCCAIGVERCGEFAASTAVVVHRLQRRTQSGAVRAGQLYETFTKRRWMFFEERHRTRGRAEALALLAYAAASLYGVVLETELSMAQETLRLSSTTCS